MLDQPLRIALVGRVNAGKSTLLNALIGMRAAPTNATECTRVTTWYRYGVPARAVVVGLDGTRDTLAISSATVPDELGRPAAEIDYVEVFLPSGQLREFELLDSPGLGTHDSANAETTRRTMTGSGGLLPRPDAALLLTASTPLADELEFLAEMGARPEATIVLLSHADNFGEGPQGAVDPFTAAEEQARTLTDRLAATASVVLPVSGLMAETALTGQMTEDTARALRELAELDELELTIAMGDPDSEGMDRLLGLVGEYGLIHGREHAAAGAAGQIDWLRQRSGIARVRAELRAMLVGNGGIAKARVVLQELREFAQRGRSTAILGQIDAATREPELHMLQVLTAMDRVRKWGDSGALLDRLGHVLRAGSDAELVGLPPGSPPHVVRAAADQASGQAHSERILAMSSSEQEALTVLAQAYYLAGQRQAGRV